MLELTKEKVLALVALLAAAMVVAGLRAPRVEEVPPVPAEEAARPYRTVSSAPRLAPERPYKPGAGVRDPFAVEDPWKEAPPALLALPPTRGWPRALPVGPNPTARSPHDRLLLGGAPPQPGGAR
ncbi:MAG: hypothetical protein M9894_32310 [Planctomycetes bacterium]|nr:hypothetical protein [Planctomycetota bacterium]